ncbi:MAG: sporulation initiation factor Spo0A C-terminal domain-containing protein [Clostridia bacterium]|nr:sporulation initiation factor Spo0A C-terminal domain-containing protein [Clostridia bacterium]
MKKQKRTITEALMTFGVAPNLRGYAYLYEAVSLTLGAAAPAMVTKDIYPAIAKKFKTTYSRVERAIRYAAECSYANLSPDTIEKLYGNSVSFYKSKPSNSHFISLLALYVNPIEEGSPNA